MGGTSEKRNPRSATQYPAEIDDIYIAGGPADFSGDGQVLLFGGQAYTKTIQDGNGSNFTRPSVAYVEELTDDIISFFEGRGELGFYALKEIGHALGINTLWVENGLHSGITTDDSYLSAIVPSRSGKIWDALDRSP
jgi:hypothetical protein